MMKHPAIVNFTLYKNIIHKPGELKTRRISAMLHCIIIKVLHTSNLKQSGTCIKMNISCKKIYSIDYDVYSNSLSTMTILRILLHDQRYSPMLINHYHNKYLIWDKVLELHITTLQII